MDRGTELPTSADVVIAGGGFAGAATACMLAHQGVSDVVLLEAEGQFGEHASGLNAAMARQLSSDELTGEVLRRSVAIWTLRDGSWTDDLEFRNTGSLLLMGPGPSGDALRKAARAAADAGLDCREVKPGEAVAAVPVLEGAGFDTAIATGADGVVDIHGLLWRYLRAARAGGTRLFASCPVEAVEVQGGRVAAVRTPRGRIACRILVDAAGSWANRLAAMAGLAPLPMKPFRRHLVTTSPLPWVAADWPFVWHVTGDWYFRPEVGGLLLSPCDQSEAEPGRAVRDPAALELLAARLATGCPALAGVPIHRWWAGLRTITRDGRFAIGPDPRLDGFVWVAGLGGHGMTASAAVGEFAAARIAGAEGPAGWAQGLGVERLL